MHKTVLAQDSVHKITPRFVVKYKASANNVRFDWGLEPWAFPDHAVDRRKLRIQIKEIQNGFDRIIHLINLLLKDDYKRFLEVVWKIEFLCVFLVP